MTLKKGFGKCSLFVNYQPMDEKIKTWTLCFPTKENRNMEKLLLDWPIVLQNDVKVISRKFFVHEVFSAKRSVNQPKRCTFVSVRQTNQITLFPFVCCFCFVRTFSLQGHTKIAL